jgi:hypothetical protein
MEEFFDVFMYLKQKSIITIIIFIFCVFRPLEHYIGLSSLTVNILGLLGLHVINFALEFVYLPFVGSDVFTLIWIQVLYNLDLKVFSSSIILVFLIWPFLL